MPFVSCRTQQYSLASQTLAGKHAILTLQWSESVTDNPVTVYTKRPKGDSQCKFVRSYAVAVATLYMY